MNNSIGIGQGSLDSKGCVEEVCSSKYLALTKILIQFQDRRQNNFKNSVSGIKNPPCGLQRQHGFHKKNSRINGNIIDSFFY